MTMIQETNAKTTHKITVCVSCRHKDTECRPGFDLIKKLQQAVSGSSAFLPEDFEVSGVACMAGCDRPCTVAYHASKKATYLFGDIDPEENIDDLLAFAHQYAALDDGWCSSTKRPEGLSGKTLARVPSALIEMRADESPVQ